MKNSGCGGGAKIERKTIEKNRRMHMKSLCLKLSSLIPKEDQYGTSKDTLTQEDHLVRAASYIKKLRESIESLKERRESNKGIKRINRDIGSEMMIGFRLPVVEVRQDDTNLEVVLISSLSKKFMFHEVISVLEEEGAEVINASFSVVGDKIFHTIHSQAFCSRIGMESSRIMERLKELIQ